MNFLEPLLEQLSAMGTAGVKMLPLLGIALIAILFTWIVSKIVQKVLKKVTERAQLRPSLENLILTLAKIAVWTIGVLVAAAIVFPSLTPAKILAALGLGSIAIGFAFQDIFENFLAGVMIMLRKTMRIGDFIECEGVEGKIEQINIRDSYIRQTDGQLVLMPNSKLFKNEVYVRTDLEHRRFQVVCGVAYDEDLEKSKSVIEGAVKSAKSVNQNKPVQVFATEFNSSSVDFTIRWWAESKPLDGMASQDEVIRLVKRALDDAGIEIPFPYRTLTFKEDLGVREIKEGKNDN
tara:strand:- start:733 stop:1608 length:876 start_codon:yes stop_codon:yes gene_type:complete